MKRLTTPVRRKERKIKMACVGGPYGGRWIELTDAVPICSAYFKVSSFGEAGRYVQTASNEVSWQPKI